MTMSGLSQWVICGGVPYSVEIARMADGPGWHVEAIDALTRQTVWSGTADDDARAFLDAVREIHARAPGAAAPAASPRAATA